MPYGYPGYGYGGYMQPVGGYAPAPAPYPSPMPQPQQMQQVANMPPKPQPEPSAQMQGQQGGQLNIICRPVASLEEAKAVPTDFTGALLVLTDFSHGAIYTKSLNYQDGSAIFKTYRMEGYNDNPPATVQQVPEYAEKKDLDALSARMDELTKVVGGIKNVGHTRAAGAKASAEQQPSD